MARANLKVDGALTEAFLSAQEEGSSTRLLIVNIRDETLCLQTLGSRTEGGSAEGDFADVLLSSISDTEAALVLYSLSDTTRGSKNNKWLFLLWVPDMCKVRDKMLYSSSKEDLKRSLGQGYFTAEYNANTRGDVTWGAFQESLNKERSAEMMSFAERTVFEERIASHAESSVQKSSAMNVLPFTLTPELLAALAAIKKQQDACNWVEMTADGDAIKLIASKTVAHALGAGSSLQPHVSEAEARFYAARLTKSSGGQGVFFFIFSCPEVTPIRQKMTMASAKASVLAMAGEQGLVFDKNVEIRDAADIDEVVRQELEPEAADSPSPSSAAASMNAKKPQRPGQKSRTTQVAKFSTSED